MSEEEPTPTPDWTRIRGQAELHRRNEEDSFRLAEHMERTALNVIGAYQNVIDRVQWLKFHQAGPGAVLNDRDKEKLPKVLREIAEAASIAWPHQEFCTLLDAVKPVRTKLAHMSWIHSIEGEFPDRVMTVVIAEQPEWVDDTWSKQPFRHEEIRESEMGEALDALWRMRTFIRALNRLISVFATHTDTPPDFMYDREAIYLPWWLPEWGTEPQRHVRADQLRPNLRLSTNDESE